MYEQTHNVLCQYTLETPQSHQCAPIGQSSQPNDQINHALCGGEICEDRKASSRCLHCHVVFNIRRFSKSRAKRSI